MYIELTQIVGLTFDKIEESGDRIVFHTQDGRRFLTCHFQNCCEAVYVEDIVGDLNDLVGAPIVRAEERTQDISDDCDEFRMWTFYELATIKGSVTIRWCGSSNGYYSVSVSLVEVGAGEDIENYMG